MKLILERFSYADTEVEGKLLLPDGARLATIEQPWRKNPNGFPGGKPFESCIPDGKYSLEPWVRPSGDECWIMINPDLGVYRHPHDLPAVDGGRYLCLIHTGNWAHDVVGCIAPGWRRHHSERRTVLSRVAMNALNRVLGRRDSHTLVIKPATGASDVTV